MIITVTLNPALDKTICVRNFAIGQVCRVEEARLDPGGKGINVSKAVSYTHLDVYKRQLWV